MVSDGVPRCDYPRDNLRPLLHKFADKEKCCFDVMLSQYIKQVQGVRIIRAVVISQGQLFAAARRADECVSVKLRTPGERVVSGESRRAHCRAAHDERKHERTVYLLLSRN